MTDKTLTYIFRTNELRNYIGRGKDWGAALRDAGVEGFIIYGSRIAERGDVLVVDGEERANQAVVPPSPAITFICPPIADKTLPVESGDAKP
jgi:hypothetical protein